MNIFILDNNLELSVANHIDMHVKKMPLEAAQMLSCNMWVSRVLGFIPRKLEREEKDEVNKYIAKSNEPWYRPGNWINHGCTIWARSSSQNFFYLKRYCLLLEEERQHRWPGCKPHNSALLVKQMPNFPGNFTNYGFTMPYLGMPEEYKSTDYVDAYRTYYYCCKQTDKNGNRMDKWTNRSLPEWWL